MQHKKKYFFIISIVVLLQTNACPNFCNGNGVCNAPFLTCDCSIGYMGADCSLRECPRGTAWSDVPKATDVAHAQVECSGRGHCDRNLGECVCSKGFTGSSCNKMKCTNDCSQHGRCLSMKDAATNRDPGSNDGSITLYEDVWDAEMIFGCFCDRGFFGHDCSKHECPLGDDPLTTFENAGNNLDEVQLISCSATSGYFTLTFQEQTTAHIPIDASLSVFSEILKSLSTINNVDVEFSEVAGPVCSTYYSQVVKIRFLDRFGSNDNIRSVSKYSSDCSAFSNFDFCGGSGLFFLRDGESIESHSQGLIFSVSGSKENVFCSNRGLCDVQTGSCQCFHDFYSSDGRGSAGGRGDCGHQLQEITSCPGDCSNNGLCSGLPTFTCNCNNGWTGGDCSIKSCASGKSWFDLPTQSNVAHAVVECSNKGACNRNTGHCECDEGFEGAACNLMSCPSNFIGVTCSGHGTCVSLRLLGQLRVEEGVSAPVEYGSTPNDPFTWEADSVQGCLCDTGFEGHDCSLKSCRNGDDPETIDQTNERQLFQCFTDSLDSLVYFTFREREVARFKAAATSEQVETAFQAHDILISVTFSSGEQFCNILNGEENIVTMKFLSEHGNVPGLIIDTDDSMMNLQVTSAFDGAPLGSSSSQTGTTENESCSRRGICDQNTGSCDCFSGFASSNGLGQPGTLPDCGYRTPFLV